MLNTGFIEQSGLPIDSSLSSSSSVNGGQPKRFGIKSKNVILEEYYEPTEAIILVENGKIVDVIVPSETDPEILSRISSQWEIEDHGNLYVFPGLVDCNVHLHSDFNGEWENISYCTEAAAAGGVTTIVDNPIMTKGFNTGDEYVESLNRRINALKTKSKVDFGIFAALEPKTQESIEKIMEIGTLGLKCYLLNCFHNTVGNFSSENFPQLMKSLQKYQDLLLVVHPEIATERELYLTSPCRISSLEKRLDMKHVIKSIELGGAANKGSYLDEICKKSTTQQQDDDDDDDDDCPTATLDTPSKLKSKIKRTQEKTEIDDLVHFELLSYSNNCNSDSDSDEETTKKKSAGPQSVTNESCSKSKEEEMKSNKEILPLVASKKSLFCKPYRQSTLVEVPEEGLKEESETVQQVAQSGNQEAKSEEKPVKETIPNPVQVFQKIDRTGGQTPNKLQVGSMQSKPKVEANKALTQTRKMLSFITACDVKETLEKQNFSNPQPVTSLAALENKELNKLEAKSTPTTTDTIEQTSMHSPSFGDSPQEEKAKSLIVSPSPSLTPASSSLLQRRLCRKTSSGVNVSTSTLSSPSSDFTKVNSLEVLKSPRSLAKKEAKFNQSYRIFLANRPQNWEENAVSLVLACVKPDTQLRVMLPNLSLASSLLRVRQKKKSNDAYLQKIFCDVSASHLFFNEKMVKKGDTKFKVSPPFRNKENRHLLVENFRLGGVDTLSSYHFFVPPRFKQIDDGNFRRAFGGLDSMGFSLQGAWTATYSHQQKNNKKFTEDLLYQKKIINHILRQLYKSLCFNPAQMLKIGERKGSIAKGRDADFVLWDPYKVNNNTQLASNHVFSEKSLLGVVNQTYLRGNLIYSNEDTTKVCLDYKPDFIRP